MLKRWLWVQVVSIWSFWHRVCWFLHCSMVLVKQRFRSLSLRRRYRCLISCKQSIRQNSRVLVSDWPYRISRFFRRLPRIIRWVMMELVSTHRAVFSDLFQICSSFFINSTWIRYLYGFGSRADGRSQLDRPQLSKCYQIIGRMCDEDRNQSLSFGFQQRLVNRVWQCLEWLCRTQPSSTVCQWYV